MMQYQENPHIAITNSNKKNHSGEKTISSVILNLSRTRAILHIAVTLMTKLLFFIYSFCAVTICSAQIKSVSNTDTNNLKKGFYKDYNEYLNNSPSIIRDFTIQFVPRDEFDSTIIGAKCILIDTSEKLPLTWGFSDGMHAYVTMIP